MKAVKEALSPTRVKLTVEVPFDELTPSVTTAYKKLAREVKVQGFRPGKVPPRVLDQRVGRGVVLDEALQEALPHFYSAAAREQEVDGLNRPQVDVTSFGDGVPLVFTAEVDVRPEFELPEYEKLPVTVDDIEVTDADVDAQLDVLRDRNAVLETVDRPAATGDYVTLDLAAEVDGQPVPGADTTGISYEVGSGNLVAGIDEAILGAAAEETRTFTTGLVAGEFAGREATVSVVIRGVKAKILPELDDEFAVSASEFDTLAELRADLAARILRSKRFQQGMQARDRVLDALLERTEVPLPESVVAAEIEARMHNLGHQLETAGMTLEDYLARQEQTREAFDADVAESARKGVKSQFVLDAIAGKEEVTVTNEELSEQVVERSQSARMAPQAYADALVQNNQLPALVAEVVRGKALAAVLEHAAVTDTSGRPVDLSLLAEQEDGAEDEAAGAAGAPGTDAPADAATVDA